jgi:hypothetical protein
LGKNCGNLGKNSNIKIAEIWEKSRYQKCGNMGKKRGNMATYDFSYAELWQLWQFFSIGGNVGKCCGIVVFSRIVRKYLENFRSKTEMRLIFSKKSIADRNGTSTSSLDISTQMKKLLRMS